MVWWKCTVCGYLYEGETPPESCSRCGVAADKFTSIEDKVETAAEQDDVADSPKQWKCDVCGHLHKGNLPPDSCPICKVKAEKFSLQETAGADEVAEKVVEEGPVKSWKCTVCGYIHEGPAPPEKCPLCGVPADKFVEVEQASEQGTPSKTISSPKKPVAKATEGERQWKCAACGYVHKGTVLPDSCPLCGVAKEQFIEAGSAASSSVAMKTPQAQSFVARMIQKHHLHPILVHFPNGILPLAVCFSLLALLGCGDSFDVAAYYNMVAVLLTLPMVGYSGYIEWAGRYRSSKTLLFKVKIGSSIIMSVLLVILLLWRSLVPNVVLAQDSMSYTYFALSCLMVGFAGITGHIGGKFVFSSRG